MPKEITDAQLKFIDDVINKLTTHVDTACNALSDFGLCDEDRAPQVVLQLLLLSYAPFFEDRLMFDTFIEAVVEQYESKLSDLEEEKET